MTTTVGTAATGDGAGVRRTTPGVAVPTGGVVAVLVGEGATVDTDCGVAVGVEVVRAVGRGVPAVVMSGVGEAVGGRRVGEGEGDGGGAGGVSVAGGGVGVSITTGTVGAGG